MNYALICQLSSPFSQITPNHSHQIIIDCCPPIKRMAAPKHVGAPIKRIINSLTECNESKSILPTDLLTILFEYVPSGMLALLEANNGFTKMILQSPNIWRHYNLNLYADLQRIQRNNPFIDIESITIPNTNYKIFYQTHRNDQDNENRLSLSEQVWRHQDYEDHILKCYHIDSNEMIYLNLYIAVDTMNDIVLNWLNARFGLGYEEEDKFVPLFIPFEYLRKIRILCYLSHINNTLNYLADYLSNVNQLRIEAIPRRLSVTKAMCKYRDTRKTLATSTSKDLGNGSNDVGVDLVTFQTRLQMDMDCFMHSQSALQIPTHRRPTGHFSDLNTITNLIVDNCDLTRQFSTDQTRPFQALPNVETLTLCCSYVSFYSSTLTTIHSMLFSSKYQPFYALWEGFANLKTIVISEKNCHRLYNDLKNSRKAIYFPERIQNLWFPHSEWFDLRRVRKLNVLCLDPCDVQIDAEYPNRCMMDEIKIKSDLTIRHLFINVTSVSTVDFDEEAIVGLNGLIQNIEFQIARQRPGGSDDENDSEKELMNISALLEKADNITFCVMSIAVDQVKCVLAEIVGEQKMKSLQFVKDIKTFRKLVHAEMEIVDVFDDEYEWMIHNKTIRDQHEQICHLDIIDDILGSITYVNR